ncbi:nuclear transport factor 2 family protein [Nakamurella leprariae]|uniref:Nuclear transport factor 2 family protein n=1 Tax=Nakamurella leprariae TaxID=2803911 RepID=A0A938YE02_9ACTN|nr:nuclear transport factor 2 family protein [Nakamurella leprariae]MBM9466439.1 nuclear transport factor 2 family protein [Nakamurella leprariae]
MHGASQDRAQAFADAVVRLESSGDLGTFVDLFADDAELVRPETGQQLAGRDGARDYWQQYLAQFRVIRSEFSRVAEGDGLGVLEWQSTGRLAGGGDISYRGVSLVDFASDGRVSRFATYFDTAKFATAV